MTSSQRSTSYCSRNVTLGAFYQWDVFTASSSVKLSRGFYQESLRTLDPDLLEGFLRAAESMEAFCTPSQLQDMELFTQSVQMQWEVGLPAHWVFTLGLQA